MPLNRRQFLKASGMALCASSLSGYSYAAPPEQPPLPIPPLIESRNGRPVFLSMQSNNWSFSHDRQAQVWGFNGRYLGPTVRVFNGDNVKFSCSNSLYEPVSIAISGLQSPGAIINNPAKFIQIDSSWSPVIPVRQSACTCWYHADTPKNMARHVYNGLAGMWIIEELNQANPTIPNQYGINDFPVILQDKRFAFSGVPEYNPPYKNGFLGNTLLTNGVIAPVLEVGKSWIRLRLLNASNSRRYSLALTDEQLMYLIASDQGLLAMPVALKQLHLAPGERKEILINMSAINEVALITGVRQGFVDNIRGLFETSDTLTTTAVLTIKSSGLSAAMPSELPQSFNVNNQVSYTAQQTRQFSLSKDGTINNLPWQQGKVNFYAKAGSQERWLISTDYPQPFHVQGAEFLVVSVADKAPAAEDQGWKDTVWVDEPVELLVRFKQISADYAPFAYYSQNLDLADAGVMGQFVVT